ncbi:uncharacterized protein LOC117320370 isoform X3 [Pecten maximus]|uniref:uncharacterized protein LOC117320370 isoform X3 n=1 Tax=Pecten maximus TaxID=6579 RepID=UPI001458B1BF|nr:uncharacterized protein LOC117320370 isoform X3 [Pecten maximus]
MKTLHLVAVVLVAYGVQMVLSDSENGSSLADLTSNGWAFIACTVAVILFGWLWCRFTDEPTVEIENKYYTVEVGQQAELRCSVLCAFPFIKSVTWEHTSPGGRPIQLDLDLPEYTRSKPDHLIINKTVKSDEGQYVCTVSSWYGKRRSTTTKLTLVEGSTSSCVYKPSMAATYPTTKKTTNFARICRLVVDVFPDIFRQLLVARLPASGLTTALRTNRKVISPLLNAQQKRILYPKVGVFRGSEKDLDVSLLYILLRNLVNIPPHKKGWGRDPDIADRSLSANIDRLRSQRNEAYGHAKSASISDTDFQTRWADIRQSIEDLQSGGHITGTFVVAVDKIGTMRMDPSTERNFIALVKEMEGEICDVKQRQDEMTTDMGNLKGTVDAVSGDVDAVKNDVSDMKQTSAKNAGEISDMKERQDEMATNFDDLKGTVDDVSHHVDNVSDEVGAVRKDVTAVSDDVGDVRKDVTAVSDDVGAVRKDVTAVSDEVGAVRKDVTAVSDDVGAVRKDVTAVSDEVGAVRKDVTAVSDEVGAVRKDVTAVSDDVGAVRKDVTAVSDDVGAVRKDVTAVKEDVSTLKHFSSTIEGTVVAVSEDVAAVKEDVSAMKQSSSTNGGRNPKLRAVIETTRLTTIDQTSKPEVISTQALEDAKEMIRKNSVVLIKGASGDGKTLMGYQLLKWLMDGDDKDTRLSKDPVQLYSMAKWDKIVEPNTQLAVYVDDVSGEIAEDLKKREVSIKSTFCGKLHNRSNCLILNVRDEIFKSTQLSSCEFFEQNIIDLRGKNCIKIAEKKLILESYVREIKTFPSGKESEIVKLAPDIGFPQCCRLYRDVPSLQKEGVHFFKQPFHFMETTLKKLPKEHFYALLFLFLNDGRVKKGDLDPKNSESFDRKKLDEAFQGIKLDHADKIRSLRKSLDVMFGSLVEKRKYYFYDDDDDFYDDDDDFDDDDDDGDDDDDDDDSIYKFCHDSVQDTVALLYGKDTKIGFIENCPRKFLHYISTSKSTANKIVIKSSSEHMYKRLVKRV